MESDPACSEEIEALPTPPLLESLRAQLRPLLVSVPLLTLLTGAAFPLALMAVAHPLFRYQAEGSLIQREGTTIGSELIGQDFRGEEYFQPRPSAAGDGYDATASAGSNLGPNNPKLWEVVRRRADDYRRRCGLAPDAPVPLDAVTSSASGLDPHISPANADLQVPRVARARSLSQDDVRRLVAEHTRGRQLGFLGEPRVAVLPLNLALDRIAPRSALSHRAGAGPGGRD